MELIKGVDTHKGCPFDSSYLPLVEVHIDYNYYTLSYMDYDVRIAIITAASSLDCNAFHSNDALINFILTDDYLCLDLDFHSFSLETNSWIHFSSKSHHHLNQNYSHFFSFSSLFHFFIFQSLQVFSITDCFQTEVYLHSWFLYLGLNAASLFAILSMHLLNLSPHHLYLCPTHPHLFRTFLCYYLFVS